MKWILLALFIVNIIFGGYQYWISTQVERSDATKVTAQYNNLGLTANQLDRLAKANAKAPVIEKAEVRCIRVEGLNAGDDLEVVESRLKALELDVRRLEKTVVIRQDFQVIVGPYPSSQLARNDLQVFSSKGVDSYVINSGSYTNALSLGVFSSNVNASRKIAEVKRLGIDAKTVVKDHTGLAYELIMDRGSASLINDETLTSVLAPFKNAKFSRYLCN